MSHRVFIKFVSDPKVEPFKAIVGLACAARAVADGHRVSVFFAAAGVRLLEPSYVEQLDKDFGGEVTATSFIEAIAAGADLHCSFGSVGAVLGHKEGDGALIVPDDGIGWSGPPGVISLAVQSDVQLVY